MAKFQVGQCHKKSINLSVVCVFKKKNYAIFIISKVFIALQFCIPHIFGNLWQECFADLTSLTKCHKVDVYKVFK